VARKKRGRLRRFLVNNGLSLVLFGLFLFSLAGQAAAGHRRFNEEQREHGAAPVDLPTYLTSGHFVEAIFENWESEFLQMAAFVLLTIVLRQKGSSESKPVDEKDERAGAQRGPSSRSPWPVRRGGLALRLYEHSLSLVLVLLFLASFALHAHGGAAEENRERAFRGEPPLTAAAYVATPRFWFESFQNWQSEFLAIALVVLLSIFLRQRGSPESKPVDSPHKETGGE
jgi:Domain of unknown function (DUF6766)